MLGDFSHVFFFFFYHLLIFFKINFFKIFLQEYHPGQGVKQYESRSSATFCWARSGRCYQQIDKVELQAKSEEDHFKEQ